MASGPLGRLITFPRMTCPPDRRCSRHAARAAALLSLIASCVAAPLPGQGAPGAPRLLRAGDIDTMPARPGQRIAYGPDSLQFGELRVPSGSGPFPVAIVVHGGCWYSPYASVRNSAPLADALAAAGVATWNVEYRRYDQTGGGWPGTFLDVAAGTDHVRQLARDHRIDTTRIVAVGHSAGAHLALWLASRHTLARSSPLAGGAPLRLAGVVSVGGIADLREFQPRERATCGVPAVESLLGAMPDSVPQRVRDASPIERLPFGVPTVHVAGASDRIAPRAVVEAFATAARAAGDSAQVVIVPASGHFETMAPSHAGGRATIDAVLRLLRGAAVRPPRK